MTLNRPSYPIFAFFSVRVAFNIMEDKNSSFPMLCKTGCGFFASREGMCSVCYKQHISKMRERDDAAVTGGAAAALQGTTFSATSPLPPSLSDPSPKDAVELTPGIIGKCTVYCGVCAVCVCVCVRRFSSLHLSRILVLILLPFFQSYLQHRVVKACVMFILRYSCRLLWWIDSSFVHWFFVYRSHQDLNSLFRSDIFIWIVERRGCHNSFRKALISVHCFPMHACACVICVWRCDISILTGCHWSERHSSRGLLSFFFFFLAVLSYLGT